MSTPRFEETGFDDDYGDRLSYYNDLCTTVLTLYLEVPAESFGQFYQVREGVQERIFDMLWPIIAS